MPAPPACGRFAPSPTGPLHPGSMVAALGSWLMARRRGGRWLVRIEDLDPPREVPGAARLQLRTLAACGMRPDGPVQYQSRHGARYTAALARLLATGDAFECHCSRAELAVCGGVHRRCVARSPRPAPAVRLRVPDNCLIGFEDALRGHHVQDLARAVGDFVLRRADGLWAYQLAVVVDDAAQGVTDVVRGADLLDSTPRQILLQQRLGLPTPRYAHLPLVSGPDGRKLSKSLAAMPIHDRAPLQALTAAWAVLGQDPCRIAQADTPASFLDLALAAFDPARIPRGPDPFLAAMHNTPVVSGD